MFIVVVTLLVGFNNNENYLIIIFIEAARFIFVNKITKTEREKWDLLTIHYNRIKT